MPAWPSSAPGRPSPSLTLHPDSAGREGWPCPRQASREKVPEHLPRRNPAKSRCPVRQRQPLSPPKPRGRAGQGLPGRFRPHTHESVAPGRPLGGSKSSCADLPRLRASLGAHSPAGGVSAVSWGPLGLLTGNLDAPHQHLVRVWAGPVGSSVCLQGGGWGPPLCSLHLKDSFTPETQRQVLLVQPCLKKMCIRANI